MTVTRKDVRIGICRACSRYRLLLRESGTCIVERHGAQFRPDYCIRVAKKREAAK